MAAFLAALAAVAVAYAPSYFSLFQKWTGDAAYSHGVLILPLSLWLAWRKRDQLLALEPSPSAWGAAAVLACVLAWLVARGSGVRVVEQFAVVAFVPALVLAACGWQVTRALAFPLAFLLFAVPFGRGLVPTLMQSTADFATLLLQWTGVPVFRSHMHISIPAGNFEVARACSGLNYLITGFVLGVLYAYLNFRGWRKRLLCVAAFVVIPVVLNGLRVYFTILVSHWTDMRFGPGYEHVTFGRIFFVLMMLALFWIGRRWHDEPEPAAVVPQPLASARPWTAWWPLAAAVAVALAGPPFLQGSIARAGARLADTGRLIALPAAAGAWQSSPPGADAWRPLYRGSIVERQVRFQADAAAPVDVFVAVYGLGSTQGGEMISYGNILYADEHKSLQPETRRRVEAGNGVPAFEVREVMVPAAGGAQLVWYWFVVGERPVAGTFTAKALEAASFVTREADSERIVALSTPLDDAARQRLNSFVQAQGRCAVEGFQPGACPP